MAALALGPAVARAAAVGGRTITVAAFPAVDDMVRVAISAFRARRPGVEVKVVSRQFAAHHTAITTALSTSFYLPDVMALEVGFVGRFARGSGLEKLADDPYDIRRFESRFVPCAFRQASGRDGAVVAAPLDIGPGTLLYRHDLLDRAGLAQTDLTQSWDRFVAAGLRLRATTRAHLVAHAREVKDILIRTGVQRGEGLYFDDRSRVLVDTPRFVRAFVMATMLLPSFMFMIPTFMLMNVLGWIDEPRALYLAGAAGAFGIFLMRQFIGASVPRDLLEAARKDGCSELGIYWRIVLPLLKPALGTLGVITFIASWNNFIGPLIVMRSPEKYTLPLALPSLQSPVDTEWGALMAGSVIATLPLLVLFALASRQLIAGLTAGAVK